MTQVHLDKKEGYGVLTLSRPKKRNALDQALMQALKDRLLEVRDDSSLKSLIIKGDAGIFSSGIDHTLLMEVFQKSKEAPFRHIHRDLQQTFDIIEEMERPVIVAASRFCVGMALELALAADFRFCTEDCVFGLPEVAFGIIPDVGGTTRLVRTVGLQKARQLILTGTVVRAQRAASIGLVDEVHDDEAACFEAACRLAEHFAKLPQKAVGLAKTTVIRAAEVDNHTSLRLEGLVQSILLEQPEIAEAFPAALEFVKYQLMNPKD